MRIASLDAARGALMLLGIVLHAAHVYRADPWAVHDPSGGAAAFDWIVLGIHSFRMEAFFWIAGFFAALGLDRMAARQYVVQRGQRLLVPFAATLLTFSVVEAWLLESLDPQFKSGGPRTIGHLWFLVDLAVFTAIAAFAFTRGSVLQRLFNRAAVLVTGQARLIIFLAAASAAPVLAGSLWARLTGLEAVSVWGLTSLDRLAMHSPYFIFGVLVYRSEHLRNIFRDIHPGWFMPAVLMNLWLTTHPEVMPRWTFLLLAQGFLTWLTIGSVMSMSARLFGSSTRLGTWLATASYPIYLFHHLVVIALGSALLSVSLPVAVKFILVVTGTFAVCSVFALLVQHSSVLNWLYTGRPLRRAGKLPAPWTAPTTIAPSVSRSSASMTPRHSSYWKNTAPPLR